MTQPKYAAGGDMDRLRYTNTPHNNKPSLGVFILIVFLVIALKHPGFWDNVVPKNPSFKPYNISVQVDEITNNAIITAYVRPNRCVVNGTAFLSLYNNETCIYKDTMNIGFVPPNTEKEFSFYVNLNEVSTKIEKYEIVFRGISR